MTAAPQLFHFCLHRGAFQREEVLPLRLKNSREYFPDRAKCLGILPSSSMMWAMWSMRREKKKGYRNGEGKGKDGIKEEGKSEISKNSELDSNQQCLQHILAEVHGNGGPQTPTGAATVTEASSPQATSALQARKHGDGQVHRRNSSLNSLVFS